MRVFLLVTLFVGFLGGAVLGLYNLLRLRASVGMDTIGFLDLIHHALIPAGLLLIIATMLIVMLTRK